MSNYLFLLLVFVTVTYGQKEDWSVKTTGEGIESYNNCVTTLNIPIDEVLKIEKITDPFNLKILKCVYIEMGYYTDGKGFHIDRIVKQLGGGDSIEKVVKRCIPTSNFLSNDPAEIQIMKVEDCFKMEKIGGYQD